LQVAEGVEGDGRTVLALAPDAQGDLLRHRPAGHEDGGLFPQKFRDLALEVLDHSALAVVIWLWCIGSLTRQRRQRLGRALGAMAGERALAGEEDRALFILGEWLR